MIYVLDACALMAYLLREMEGGLAVKELFARAAAGEITICMHIVNLTEVYYLFIQRYRSVEQSEDLSILWIR